LQKTSNLIQNFEATKSYCIHIYPKKLASEHKFHIRKCLYFHQPTIYSRSLYSWNHIWKSLSFSSKNCTYELPNIELRKQNSTSRR